ncbi:MAG: chromosome segregation protein SMC [Firmicutes bacterium]|nr:chromosome segregation protein SMC [Alicyclobacillaceae bacterium]MCL6496369.1 chromosome segregation protein SMC [Bacillota bacterium]
MYLREIELFGFKSFARGTRIQLAPGISALVGPNGGGKSNVVDAVRFALGEQRPRELRLESWDDLLFAGSRELPPARMAEVTLSFDNQDRAVPDWPDSLAVTRRYYRGGTFEYAINGRPARLRDVLDLFWDRGVGRNAYAVIGQGRVDQVLFMHPREREQQLDEVAQVSRFKARRREVLSHLQAAAAELARVTEAIQSVKRDQAAVAEAAEREAQWRALREEAQRLREREQVTRFREAQRELAALADQRRALASQRQALTEAAAQARAELERLAREAEQWAAAADRWEGERRRIEEQWAKARDAEARHRAEAAGARAEEEALRERLEALETEPPLEAPTFPVADPRTRAEGVAAVARLREAIAAAQAERSQIQAAREFSTAQVATLRERAAQLDHQWAMWCSHLELDADADLVGAWVRWREAVASAGREVRRLSEELHQATTARTRLVEFVRGVEEQVATAAQQLAQRQARLRALRQLEAEGAGLAAGVRAVLQAHRSGRFPGLLGTLGSLLETEPHWLLALTVALGGAHQYLVIQSAAEAREAVEWLQAHGAGRATFLPLDILQPNPVPPGDLGLGRQPGAVGWMADLVRYPPGIRPAVLQVLGRVLVATTLEAAVTIGRRHRFRYRTVTLDGQVVQPGGAITGGSSDDRHGVTARRVEMEELERRVREGDAYLAAQRELLTGSRQELAALEVRIEGLREKLSEDRHRWQTRLALAQRLQHLPDPEVLAQERASVRAALAEAEAAARHQEAAWEAVTQRLAAAESELREKEAALGELQWQERMVAEMEARRRQWLTRRAQDAQDLRQRLAQVETVLAEHQQQAEAKAREAAEWRRQWDAASAESERVAEALRQNRARRQAVEEALGRVEAAEQQWWQSFTETERRVGELRAAWSDYVPPPGVEPWRDPAEAEAGQARLQAVEQALAAMGPIEAGSLAWWRQLDARRAQLEAEASDVTKAKRELEAVVHDLDREVARRLAHAARAVEDAFNRACGALLDGRGGLEWVSGEEGGIELWVEPAGKARVALARLSGGERALSGIAWLFALIDVHPAPFVILDEVEAALDEANVHRFARFLAERKHQAQYIVVTHHRATMGAADVLWGFSQQRRGATSVVAVRLQPEGADEAEGGPGHGLVGSPA